jgi:hypothetical protein
VINSVVEVDGSILDHNLSEDKIEGLEGQWRQYEYNSFEESRQVSKFVDPVMMFKVALGKLAYSTSDELSTDIHVPHDDSLGNVPSDVSLHNYFLTFEWTYKVDSIYSVKPIDILVNKGNGKVRVANAKPNQVVTTSSYSSNQYEQHYSKQLVFFIKDEKQLTLIYRDYSLKSNDIKDIRNAYFNFYASDNIVLKFISNGRFYVQENSSGN